LLFNVGVWRVLGPERGQEFLAAYLLEKSLSVDNLFVFLLIFGRFGIKSELQRRVLTWGIIGALVSRGIFIGLGAAAIQRWHWVLYVFGGLLIVIGLRMLKKDDDEAPGEGRLMPFLQRHLPYTSQLEGPHFMVHRNGRRVFTPLMLALVAVEMTDVVFAIDSIPAAFAITTEPFIIYSSNIFAILGLRSLYLLLAGALGNLKYLHYGLAVVLCFAGVKMLGSQWFHLPSYISLSVIIGCVGISVVASLLARRGEQRASPPVAKKEDAAREPVSP
jgi:tellurite resistance protein TerC